MPASSGHPDPDLLALGIRQPWAELILRGVKTIEIRAVPTNVRGPVYLYSGRKLAETPAALTAARAHRLRVEELPLGVLVGTVDIHNSSTALPGDAVEACVGANDLIGRFSWRLRNPCRLPEPLPVRFLPYGIWFYPFKRRAVNRRRRRPTPG